MANELVVGLWKNEILGIFGVDNQPVYTFIPIIVDGNEYIKLRLMNPIEQQPTEHSARNMNNLFYFYNFMMMNKGKYSTSGLSTNTITEEIRNIETNTLIASNVSQKDSDTKWTITEKLFDTNGITVVQQRQIIWNKVGNEWTATIT